MLAIAPAFVGERLAGQVYPFLEYVEQAALAGVTAPMPMAIGCFLVIGPCEELAKFLAVRLFVYRNKEFNEPLDGIIYAAAAALGFASLENVLYVIDWHTGHVQWGALGHSLAPRAAGARHLRHDVGLRARAAEVRCVVSRLADGDAGGAVTRPLRLLLMYRPTQPLILLYMSLMVPIIVRQIRLLRAESPFAPGGALAAAPPPAADGARDASGT